MKKRLIFEVEEGLTNCRACPFWEFENNDSICNTEDRLCDRLNLSTIEFIKENEENS